jgi:hypothetical protein
MLGFANSRKYSQKGPAQKLMAGGGILPDTVKNSELLQNDMYKLLNASLASHTWLKYQSGWNAFKDFEKYTAMAYEFPLSKEVLRAFTVWCLAERRLKPTSTKAYLSALSCLQKLLGHGSFDPHDSLVAALLKGSENLLALSGSWSNKRRVMTLPLLRHLGHNITMTSWDRVSRQTVWSACVTAFFGSFRMGEILAPSDFSCDPATTLTWSSVLFRADNSVLICLKSPKSGAKDGEFVDLFSFPGMGCCPVLVLQSQLRSQQSIGRGRPSDPVFVFSSGRFLSPTHFNVLLRQLLADICDFSKDVISGHSFRAAIPSAVSRNPDLASSSEVQGWGRWKSDCYNTYIRLRVDQKRSIFEKIVNALS